MVLIEKLWDDVMAGPQPDKGLGKLRKSITLIQTHGGEGGEGASKSYQRSLSMPGSGSGLSSPGTPGTPVTPNTYSPSARKDNVWRSVFNPGSNIATKRIGAEVFDKPSHPNAPTVYDWLYSGDTRSKHQ
ncbi:auxin-repressed 12.5 kDa protein [Solanum tuberosum]|uniref:Auxin repressed/dormancy associated protein n=1 Tax=Solanum tuberosum TaxID=4113 RepID=M1AZ24_SOLTU|nr:PREDICTED: auxin-repressed 12.5 kDa protein-like [Solanum tuberosum]